MNSFRFFFVLALISIFVFPGCNKYKVPAGFPKPDKMAEILADIHIAESTMNYAPGYTAYRDVNLPGHYKFILQRHGITTEQFDTIRKWYVANPDLFQIVYGKVLNVLNERDAMLKLQIQREKEQEALAQVLDSIEIELWKDSTALTILINDTIDKQLPFHYITDTLQLAGTISITAFYKFLKEDESRVPKIMLSAFYPDSTADTVYKDVPHSFQRKGAMLNLEIKKDLSPSIISGYLLMQDSLIKSSVEITDISIKIVPGDTIPQLPLTVD